MRFVQGIVYRSGALTASNFTPRPGIDTVAESGGLPGLSAFTKFERAVVAGSKGQAIDLLLLESPLAGILDAEEAEHLVIAPLDEAGDIDLPALDAWAASRGTGVVHPYTQMVLDAVVEANIRRL